MFEVLAFVFENYAHDQACPELAHLERKLNAVGFEADEIQEALAWLDDLNLAARGLQPASDGPTDAPHPEPALAERLTQSPNSMRVYATAEQNHLGPDCLGFITFLESAGVLPAYMREIVMDRAMAAPGSPVPLDDLKIIVLMVFWSLGLEPDALVLDELCEDSTQRVAH
jgi:Smg protein